MAGRMMFPKSELIFKNYTIGYKETIEAPFFKREAGTRP
jgi:hypothetical protein